MIRVTFLDGTTADLPEETPVRPLGTVAEVTGETCEVLRNGVWTPCLVEADFYRANRMEAEADRLRAELATVSTKLREVENQNRINEALVNLATRRDRVTLAPDGSVTQAGLAVDLFAETCLMMLEATGAKNLVSFRVSRGTQDVALVTIQRPDGKTSEELRIAETARADAAEQRIAALRAWAEERVATWEDMARRASDNRSHASRTHIGDVFAEVVDRIDGKETR